MKQLKLFWTVIKRLKFNTVLLGFAVCFLVFALLVMMVEPGINTYPDALWYLFVASTSTGFGDFVAITPVGRILTVVLTVYEIALVAMLSGAVVSYYIEVVHRREKLTATMFLDKMEHLSQLSHDELVEIETKIRTLSAGVR